MQVSPLRAKHGATDDNLEGKQLAPLGIGLHLRAENTAEELFLLRRRLLLLRLPRDETFNLILLNELVATALQLSRCSCSWLLEAIRRSRRD